MVTVTRYTADQDAGWDSFVAGSKNGVFLFQRNYMDYHSDRFVDSSLMFHDEAGRLIAVMPASTDGGVVISHAGLTFGGVVTGSAMRAESMLDVFASMIDYFKSKGLERLLYKAIPHIYHALPAEEDLYALFRHGAQLVRRDLSAAIRLEHRIPLTKGRKWALGHARKQRLTVRQSVDFEAFMKVEGQLLATKYGATPVHSAEEIGALAEKFPHNIKLFAAYAGESMVAGVIIYESVQVAHTQYIGATEEGKRACALDLILDELVNRQYADKAYFDFGISTEDGGRRLNGGLFDNKQSYGARAVVYDFYELDLTAQERVA